MPCELRIIEDVAHLIARITPYESSAVCKHLRVDQSRRVNPHGDIRRIRHDDVHGVRCRLFECSSFRRDGFGIRVERDHVEDFAAIRILCKKPPLTRIERRRDTRRRDDARHGAHAVLCHNVADTKDGFGANEIGHGLDCVHALRPVPELDLGQFEFAQSRLDFDLEVVARFCEAASYPVCHMLLLPRSV